MSIHGDGTNSICFHQNSSIFDTYHRIFLVLTKKKDGETKVYINKDQSQNLKILSSHLDSLGFKKGDFIFGLDNNLGYIFFLKGIIPGGFTFGKEGLPLYLYDFKKKYNSFDNFFVIIEKDEFNEINNIFQNSGFSLNNNHRKSIISQLNLIVLSPLKK